jgi:tripeptidyl-peptidase-1
MCLKQMYNVGNYTAKLSSGSKIGFGSFLNQSAIVADALLYETTFDIPMQNFSVELISGGIDNQSASIQYSVEANLDVQTIIGVSHPLPVAEFITGGFP